MSAQAKKNSANIDKLIEIEYDPRSKHGAVYDFIQKLDKNPKAYFLDLGLRNHIINNFNQLEKRADTGALMENFVFLRLRNSFPDKTINYWRTTAKAEVDFILRPNDELIPIEVKYQTFQKPKISRSLRSFIKTYKPKKTLMITKDSWGHEKIEDTTIMFAPAHYI